MVKERVAKDVPHAATPAAKPTSRAGHQQPPYYILACCTPTVSALLSLSEAAAF